MGSENRYQVEGGVAQGSYTCKDLQAGCGQEEPGSIMRVKLATGVQYLPTSKILTTNGT